MEVRFSSVVRACISSLTMLAMACGPVLRASNNASADDMNNNCNGHLSIPQETARLGDEQWHLLVSRSGGMMWNGQDVDDNTMKRYMIELSQMPAEAGKLTIHIQPETPCDVVRRLRRTLENSPLCIQGRCVQDRWDYERTIVN